MMDATNDGIGGDRWPAVVLLLGPPGSGKGTLARALAREQGLVHVDMGALLRARAAQTDPVARRIARAQSCGEMVPKELVLATLAEHLGTLDADARLVLDGFPRTATQVAAADDGRVPVRVETAFWLEASTAVVRQRLAGRRARGARADDAPEVVARRMHLVGDTIEAVRVLYERRGQLEVIDATGPPDRVHRDVVGRLGLIPTRG